jgi:hypothetical protein
MIHRFDYDPVQHMENIANGDLKEVIAFAKSYNIFQTGGTKFYKAMCDQIKQRLDKEGLSYEIVRPE